MAAGGRVSVTGVKSFFPEPFRGAVRRLRQALGRPDLKSLGRRYDAETVEVMRRRLGPSSVCVDVGAHKGAILSEMQRLAPTARHFAFEPIPELAERLREEFPDARIHDCALGEQPGRASFNWVKNAPAYSGLVRRTYDRADPVIESIDVEVCRLDDVVPATADIAFIKIDVEGGEYDAMRGGAGTIRRCRPIIVFEAGEKSTAHYGVSPEMIHDLVVGELGLRLSLMRRWLDGESGFSKAELVEAYERDCYFIAYP